MAWSGDLLAWMPMLALPGTEVRRWEPKRLRMRLFTIPAARAHHARRRVVHLAETARWAHLAKQAIDRLRELHRLGIPQAVPG